MAPKCEELAQLRADLQGAGAPQEPLDTKHLKLPSDVTVLSVIQRFLKGFNMIQKSVCLPCLGRADSKLQAGPPLGMFSQ